MNFRIFQTDRFTMDFGIGPQQLLDLTIRCMGKNIQKVVMIFDHNSVDEKNCMMVFVFIDPNSPFTT